MINSFEFIGLVHPSIKYENDRGHILYLKIFNLLTIGCFAYLTSTHVVWKKLSFSSYYFFRIMSDAMINEIPSSLNGLITEIDNTVKESGVHNEDEETWLYRSNEKINIYLYLH